MRRWLVLLLTTLTLCASCTSLGYKETAGAPVRRTLPPLPPVTTVSLPPRPSNIPLAGRNACKILKQEQLSQLSLDRGPLPDAEKGFGNAPTCSYRNSVGRFGARLALVTVSGADVWLSEQAGVEARAITVGGFGALTVTNPNQPDFCNVEVDVADGQFLDVLYRNDGNNPAPSQETLCKGAQRVAESAMTSLKR
ncbi:DUF3558 domain-containing protein [Pseudonocardiaceae bacterium YIM PH 21723]|nr:DUF3558 domain-containing protein [Pseudonocardiaceae bacterium YIM PH 21723]